KTEYPCGALPSPPNTFGCINGSRGITAGPDGRIWMLGGSARIASIDTNGTRSSSDLHFTPAGNEPRYITAGADGNLWFTQAVSSPGNIPDIGRITPGGIITQFPLPNAGCPEHITPGPDGNVWMTDDCSGFVSSIAPDGTI